jgi:hypothetical protein
LITGRRNYRKEAEDAHYAAAVEKATTALIRNRSEREQATQEYALEVSRREHLHMLHQANAVQTEAVLLSVMADRVHTERRYLDALRARDGDGSEHARQQALAACNHDVALGHARTQVTLASFQALKAEAALREAIDALAGKFAPAAPASAPPAEEEDAPEFVAAFAEEERRAQILRTAKRKKDAVLRGASSERSKREQLDQIDQAAIRALKRYDLGQAGIVMPEDDEE